MSYSNQNYGKQRRQSNNPALARSIGVRGGQTSQPGRSNRDEYDAVPMEYRAQVRNRCQRQFVQPRPRNAPGSWRSHIQTWHEEWLAGIKKPTGHISVSKDLTQPDTLLYEAEIDWRLITNSGLDEGFIRPVINSRGWPVIPGSSIKGLFRRQWQRQGLSASQLEKLCGSLINSKPLHQGLLRFHGALINDLECLSKSLDITHPQEDWQLGSYRGQGQRQPKAYGLVSLWKPKLLITISSQRGSISDEEWQIIQEVLQKSLGAGIGGRTAAGYGRIRNNTVYDEVFVCKVRGQGIAPKLLDTNSTAEFRPVSIRASIRSMAMRLFAGLIPPQQATKVVELLFGSLNGPTVGLLGCHFQESSPIKIGRPVGPGNNSYGYGSWQFPPPMVMNVQGTVLWELVKPCSYKQELKNLVTALHGLVMCLGGFSKGWRRADHRIFPFYRDGHYYEKTPIGCQWDWLDVPQQAAWIHVRSKAGLEELIEGARNHACIWLRTQGLNVASPPELCPTNWREVIHPQKMKIWTRLAESFEDCRAIDWFHSELIRSGNKGIRDVRFKNDILIGTSRPPSRVGHIWHRMLSLQTGTGEEPEDIWNDDVGRADIVPETRGGRYLEILSFFTGIENRGLENDFLLLMNKGQGGEGVNFRPVDFA